MTSAKNILEHMDVLGSDGGLVGTVDRIEGGWIKLTKDSGRDGQHHYIPMDWVESAEGAVQLRKGTEAARQEWRTNPA